MQYGSLNGEGNERVTGLMPRLIESREAGIAEEQQLVQFRRDYARAEHGRPEIAETTLRAALDEALQANGFSGAFNGVMAHHPMFDTARYKGRSDAIWHRMWPNDLKSVRHFFAASAGIEYQPCEQPAK